MTRILAALLLPCLASPISADARQVVPVGRFSEGSLDDWSTRSFSGETRYRLVQDPERNIEVLEASASGGASGRFTEVEIDLEETPFLNWSWKVTRIFPGLDELQKNGDDFPARIYVVVKRGFLDLTSISLNYVWASSHAAASVWTSPYTDQVRLMAVDSGTEELGEWVVHKRDLRADLRRVFGEDIDRIDTVALMTDADDHGGEARSFYGDIWFSAN
ncbi:DUF3047 domain-containing protein [Geminicoccus roseus]|uniref:DUF3047 domain-containing protein n=1 Tax=Geminicoccus roseus TaxID=404900 RepID=UPI000406E99C|nr:DUF3047 domain-containing protein [Geminicoccus roseus]